MTIRVPIVFCCFIVAGYTAIAPGENAYLPPNEGYSYPRPKAPFHSSSPSPRPSTSIQSRPSPPRPTYGPSPPVPTRPPQATVPPPYSPSPSPYRPPYGPVATPFKPVGPPVRPTGPKSGTTAPGYLPPPVHPPGSIPSRPTQIPQKPPTPYIPPVSIRPTPGPYKPSTSPRPQQPAPSPGQSLPSFGENDHLLVPHKPGNPFDFNYAVKDEFGNDYSHNAVNDGDTTKGEYRIQLPDGRTQVVKYSANWASGFHAKISYEGQPTLPGGSGYSRPAAGQQSTSGGGYIY